MQMDPAQKAELEALAYVKPIDEATERGDSEIQLFYKDATVFFTGGTGFIGKQLIEKLFRSCDIKKAFVLIRPKKGVPTKERLQTMLSDPVFEPVRKKKPDLVSRIVYVEGDVASLRLGISDADWQQLVEEVDIIFHVAATVRFEEPIRTATLINIRGTRETLRLGKACKKLRSFVHVSTAYCHATSLREGRDVKEEFYECPVPPETMLTLAETVDNGRLETMTSSLISGWPNTYTFTKAIAEELIHAEAENLPVCIVRPTIVINTYREPVPGWLDMSSVFGPTGILVGVGIGILRVVRTGRTLIALVPVDYVNNATIAAGWETAVRRTSQVTIYTVSSTSCGVTFRNVSVPMRKPKIRALVTPKCIWYCYLVETNNRFIFFVLWWLLHYIPGYAIDGVITLLQLKKPPGLKSFSHVYSKMNKLTSVFDFFMTREWHFDDSNTQNLLANMSETDKIIYNFDVKTIDWDYNTLVWCLGARKYIIKDGLQGTKKAVARQKWFKLANYAVFVIYFLIFWKILSWVYYFIKCLF